jgi:hypothetical protein
VGVHRSVADYAVFIWKEPTYELLCAVATDYCLCLVDDRAQFLRLKTCLEALFVLTPQDGNTLRFLNLRIIQSHHGASIDQTGHIIETVIEPYFVSRDMSEMIPITHPFPTKSMFERDLYDSPIMTGSKLQAIEKAYGGSLFHWSGILLHIAITTSVDLGYDAIMRISGYLAAPTAVIFQALNFQALNHTMRYLYVYRHLPIFYPRRPPQQEGHCYAFGQRVCGVYAA